MKHYISEYDFPHFRKNEFMSKVLVINTSVQGDDSVSRQLVGAAVSALNSQILDASVAIRDLIDEPIPHLTTDTVAALRGGVNDTAEQRAALDLSDKLIAEIMEADTIVFGVPMYNFGIPSVLKSWFDYILRVGETFNYSEEGPKGLVDGKRVLVVQTSGGFYSEGPALAMNSLEPHLRNLLTFIGVTDVTVVRAEKLAFGDEVRADSIGVAETEIHAVVNGWVAAA